MIHLDLDQSLQGPHPVVDLYRVTRCCGGPKFPQCEPTGCIRRRAGSDHGSSRCQDRAGHRGPSPV